MATSQGLLSDPKKAMTALINLALSGSEEARTQVQSLLENTDTLTRVSWRHVLDDVTEEELASAIRDLLPRSISRVQSVEGGSSLGISLISPLFLRDWSLPESVKEEVASTLTNAVTDPDVALPDRQSAAIVLGLKAEQFREEQRHQAVNALLDVLTRPFEAHDTVRSIDDPLSMLRMNIGQEQDVIAAAAGALLRFFELIDDQQQRQRVIDEVGKLRASQVEPIGRSIAAGLSHLATMEEHEERWLRTRLLLLLDSHHPSVRQEAARSLAALVERNTFSFDSELQAAVLFLAGSSIVEDRQAAAYALSRLLSNSGPQTDSTLTDAIGILRDDPSYLVRHHVSDIS